MKVVILSLLCVGLGGTVNAGAADEKIDSIVAAYKAGDCGKALKLAEAAAADAPARLAAVLLQAGAYAAQQKEYAAAAHFYRLLVDTFPEHEELETARTELAACYYYTRELDECFALLKVNLRLYPNSPWTDYWQFLIGQIHFRRWRYTEAKSALEEFIAEHPKSQYTDQARAYLGRIDPPLEVDGNGIVAYTGKYTGDVRLKAAMEALPRYRQESFRVLHERLGVDLRPHARVLYAFKDGGRDISGGLKATTRLIGIKNKPTVIIYFYTEKAVTNQEGFRKTVVHETKHAGFLGMMGDAYHNLPKWIREGLALWGSEDIEARVQLVLCNRIAGGKDPAGVLDGIEDPDHTNRDYLEDVLAFEWLSARDPGNVATFCRRLTNGEPYRKIWAELSGLSYEQAMKEANAYCRQRVGEELGDGYRAFAALQRESGKAARKGGPAAREWLESGGRTRWQQWLADHSQHAAEPASRLFFARSLIIAGEYVAARELLNRILEEDSDRSSLMDDSLYLIGASYNHERDNENANRAFGALLRDYPSCQYARQLSGRIQAAGPVTE